MDEIQYRAMLADLAKELDEALDSNDENRIQGTVMAAETILQVIEPEETLSP